MQHYWFHMTHAEVIYFYYLYYFIIEMITNTFKYIL